MIEKTIKKVIIFGGNGKFGSYIVKNLKEQKYEIINLADRQKSENNCHTITYDNAEELASIVKKLFNENYNTVIFAQRSKEESKSCLDGIYRELIPYYATEKAIMRLEEEGKEIHMISLNSFAAIKISRDISFDYHVRKGASLRAALAIGLNKSNIRFGRR